MSAGVGSSFKRIGGRMVLNPTGRPGVAAYPYGGTEIGLVKQVEYNTGGEHQRIKGEEYGGGPVAHTITDEMPVLAWFARSFDAHMVQAIRGGGTPSGTPAVNEYRRTSSPPGGQELPTNKVLYVPEDRTNDIFIMLFAAAIFVNPIALLPFQLREEFGIPILAAAQYDASGRLDFVGPASKFVDGDFS